jgi:hypothetical protein
MFQQVCLLSERFTTVLAPERLLAGVCSKVDLDVRLVEEAPVTDLTMVHHLLPLVALAAAARNAAAAAAATARAAVAADASRKTLKNKNILKWFQPTVI